MPIPSISDVRPARLSKVTSSATEVVTIVSPNPNRAGLTIYNNGAQTEYLGPLDTVTVATGYPVAAGAAFPDSLSTSGWYAIRSSGTADFRIVEVLAKGS